MVKRTKDRNDPKSVLAALVDTHLDTIIGPISWKGGPNNPVKNVCKTPLVGGQWNKGAGRNLTWRSSSIRNTPTSRPTAS